ncbi:MAG TPA: nitronate monooxygenase, partial [Nocardioides sp.]|nr:nitronate monooxygenase [Nocardioides sp.]
MNTLLGSGLPVAAAPLAGGPTTVDLARAAADAGAFAFMPAGYKTAAQLDDDLAAMEGLGRPFGVNLFVPQPD